MPFYVSVGRSSLSSLSTNISPYHYVSPGGGSVWKGPRKICIFCTLAIVFPALLISIPLLMRFVLYGTSHHFLNPSDMKIMDNRISTIWCQGETVRANTTFTAYVTEGEPSLIDAPTHLTYNWNFIIPDDNKQYWGFYLLKGSRFKLRACARHRGGTLLVVQGETRLEYCAYIGEEDSAGNSDEISSSNSFETNHDQTKLTKPSRQKTFSQEELSNILTKIRYYIKSNHKNHGVLKQRLADWLLIEKDEYEKRMAAGGDDNGLSTHSPLEMLKSILDEGESLNSTHFSGSQSNVNGTTGFEDDGDTLTFNSSDHKISEILSDKNGSSFPLELLINSVERGTIIRNRRHTEVRRKSESGENGAFEDNTPDQTKDESVDTVLGIIHPRMKYLTSAKPKSHIEWPNERGDRSGVLNHTFGDNKDGSDSESESSFSSSEEALQKCEGVLATFNIIRDENCGPKGSYEDLEIYTDGGPSLHVPGTEDQFMYFYEDTVNVSGYYYFIFGSENEKRDNIVRAKFEMDKLVYHLPEPVENCTNVKECHIDFKFASSQKVVVQIPERLRHPEIVTDQIFVAETECHPRTHLYMVFAFLVPIVILLCAFQ